MHMHSGPGGSHHFHGDDARLSCALCPSTAPPAASRRHWYTTTRIEDGPILSIVISETGRKGAQARSARQPLYASPSQKTQ